ncbi:MAG: hypothetical protein J6R44_04955 [Clostridia bacterium]|nr:hypothetical protein [Clostridia bacterium]
MKKIAIILVIILTLSLTFSVIACGPNKTPTPPPNNNDNNVVEDGFVKATTTVEDLSEDIVKSLLNTAKTASTNKLNASNPCVSWHIDFDVVINEAEAVATFEINYDHRDKSKTEMKLAVDRKGETQPFISVFYFQDTPINGKNPGNLYFQYGDARVKVPVVDTFLGQLFPISFSGVEDSVLIGFFSANLYTKGNIEYKYKDGGDGKRTRNYVFQVDLKATLVNILNMIKGGSGFEDIYGSVSWIIESLFGVDADKISTQLPETTIKVDVTTTGGSRTLLGNGAISNLKVDATVAASDYKDSIFRGESYKISIGLVEFKASSKLIEEFPKEESNYFTNYISYNDTAMVINGALVYLEDEETIYDITVGFRYDGLGATQENDEIKILVTEKDKPENKIIEFYAFDDKVYFNFYCKEGDWVETTFAFDVDYFIEYMIDIGSTGDSFGLLKTIAYTLGSIQIWEDGSLSLNVNKEFYQGLLNLDIPTLVKGIKDSCVYAGGSPSDLENQIAEHDTDLNSVLSSIVIEKELLLIFDNGDDSIDTTDDLIDESLFD